MTHFPRLCAVAAAVATLAQAYAQDSTLAPVDIRAARETYRQPAVSAATRDAVPLEQLPQSVVPIPRKLIEDQEAQTVLEALRNASSVRPPEARDFYNVQTKVRGFNAANLIDGVAMPSLFSNLESTVSVESIEVLKGPAPALASGGQAAGAQGFVGGAIGITTKSPEPVVRREVGLRVGNHSERGVWADLNQPVSDALALRLVAESHEVGSETAGVVFKRRALFPSLRLKPSADSELLVKARVSRLETLDYSGLPPEGTLLPTLWTVPRSFNVTAAGQPPSTSEVDSLNVKWTQKLAGSWAYDVQVSRVSSRLDQNGVFTDDFFAPNPGPFYFLTGLNLTQKAVTTGASATVRGEVDAAGVRHKLTFGLDLDRTTDYGYMAGPLGGLGLWDITNPVAPAWIAPVPNLPGAQDNRYRSTALFAQDRLTVGQRLHLLAALRYTRIRADNQWPDFGVSSLTTNSKFTPRLGAVYEWSPQVSTFAGYGEGMSVPTNGIYATPPRPEQSRQFEVGLRLKNLGGWYASVAMFDLRRRNVPIADPLMPFQSIQSGEQRSSGLDADWRYEASKSLTFLGHFTRQNPRVTQDTTIPVGNQLFNVPKTSARLAVRHDWREGALRGLGIGLGATYRSALPGNSANTFFTPASTVWDAQLSWLAGPARYSLAISNLTDRKTWEPSAYFSGNHVIPSARRQVTLGASFSF